MQDPFERIREGDLAEVSHLIVASDLDAFAKLTGDDNPLHMSDEYAEGTEIGHRVAHGMLAASFISTVIGTKLPGAGALWLEQDLKFLAPVRIDEKVRVVAKVIHKSNALRVLVLDTTVYGEGDIELIKGSAKVKVPANVSEDIRRPDGLPGGQEISCSNDMSNKGCIIVTGGSRGIGAAVAKVLAGAGYPVLINCSKRIDHANEIAKEIVASDGQAAIYQADVSNWDSVQDMVAFAESEYGMIEGAVNNASPRIRPISFEQLSWDQIQRHLDVQVRGAFNVCKTILPFLCKNRRGVIVNIGSIVTDNSPPEAWTGYTLAKAALVSLTRSLAVEYGRKGILVNCVSPGMTHTELVSNISGSTKRSIAMASPLGRLGYPKDVAEVVGFLFSDAAKYMTGQTIRICGGSVMS